ncbi:MULTISPECIES: helix-turn-helix domain-containing protein [unclassified Rhizobium]|uniref:AlbA family DNA-binding domain-containing protein n=1 Tax=unclassified Rhizobium TaxID=2613769 RepID=UPI001C82AE20|nr:MULTISPECIES: ATP-binding protein [unclassified Rhizobium]MBX5239370.1 ATP-binding protein [Rhizobium sp. NLR22b]MBX5303145.1 ATP-binding protein [Rhizobium sp. NLR12b]
MEYDELISRGETAVRELIGKQETLQLEFKANEQRDPIFQDGALTKSGRKLLAKEASAFANSAGGVIVFGVDCRAVDGIDQAEKLTPISNIQRAETSVRDAASELLQPRHDGIRVASISTASDLTSGFVIVDVPRSERRPHRSEATDQKQYFKRSGSRSYPMEHYDIEDAFKRTTAPSLSLKHSLRRTMTVGSDEGHYHLEIAMLNDGAVSAKSVTLQIWNRQGSMFGHDFYSKQPNFTTNYEGREHIAAPADFVIHPGETRKFHHFTFEMARKSGVITVGKVPLEGKRFSFDYAIGADSLRIEERTLDLTDTIKAEAEKHFPS